MRRILVVTYHYPPSTTSGAARWGAMVRHMRALGHRVWVITSAGASGGADGEPDVVAARDLVTSSLLRRVLRRPALAQTGGPSEDVPAPALLTSVLVPDAELLSWGPSAYLAARRLLAREEIDCLITTGPPDSAHVVGLALGARRPAWIADFRDGWTFQPLHAPWPTAAQRRLDAALERAVATRAQRTIGATRPIADDLAARLGARAHCVSNGWDPALEADVAAARVPIAPADGWVTLVHTGVFNGPRSRGPLGRDPRGLLEALRDVNAGAVHGGRRVRLVLAGRERLEDREIVAAAGLGDAVVHVGLLDRAGAVALQRSADAVLLVTGAGSSEATGKLFEYLASGRPILALAAGNEAARIVAESGCGVAVAPGDVPAIERALRALAAGTLERSVDPAALERYVYPGPARAALELVEEAIDARRAAVGTRARRPRRRRRE